ncbi:hypothetical protein H8B09_25710 [Paenibacillus sp. PR3]|uniref:Uncharacterized protein n=1 Tax=Paenibacillus terricola TaxID=2763503 RepID=A0ABR8N1W9_9BACL|nr:hypothetical protein [Paenibacillus terricola]MBD3922178.1 hypothetical protein [Paenibacillus terricola]
MSRLSRRLIVTGMLLCLLVPAAVFFIMMIWLGEGAPDDFQYHDNYFVVVHWDWVTYWKITLGLLVLYASVVAIGRMLIAAIRNRRL